MDEQTVEELQSELILNTRNRRWIKDSWNSNIENLLKCFGEKSAASAKLHLNASNHYNKISNKFTYSVILLSTVAGTAGFSSKNTILNTLIASINILNAIISSFQKFSRSDKKSEKHRQTSADFSNLYRAITMELSIDRDERSDAIDSLDKFKREYDRILTNSEHVPSKLIESYNKQYGHRKNNPDQCNGLSQIIINSPEYRELQEQDNVLKLTSFYKLKLNTMYSRKEVYDLIDKSNANHSVSITDNPLSNNLTHDTPFELEPPKQATTNKKKPLFRYSISLPDFKI